MKINILLESLKRYQKSNNKLLSYLNNIILPKYNNKIIDEGHREDHILNVVKKALSIADELKLSDREKEIVITAAMMHDIGLLDGDRENHHINSAKFIKNDKFLNTYFTKDEINLISDAVEDHRASSKEMPRSIYGKIISTADKNLDPANIIKRTILFRKEDALKLPKEEQYEFVFDGSFKHFKEKYGKNGYLSLPFYSKEIKKELEKIYELENEGKFRYFFDKIFYQIFPK